jgi:hypothetical protein
MLTRSLPALQARPARLAIRWQTDFLALAALAIISVLCVYIAYWLPTTSRIDVGSSYAQLYLRGFFPVEKNADFNYAFTSDQAELRLPGLGRGVHQLDLHLSGWRPDAQEPAKLTVYDGSRLLGVFTLADQTQFLPKTYTLLVPSESGDVTLRLLNSTFTPNGDRRQLGIVVDWVKVHSRAIDPGLGQLVSIVLAALLLFVLLRQLAVQNGLAALATVAVLCGLTWMLANERLWWTIYTQRLWGLLLGVNIVVPLLGLLLGWLWRRGNVVMSARNTVWLLRILALAAVVKIGGVIYPHIIVYDQRYHVPRTQMVLNGEVIRLLTPSDVTALSVTVGLEGGHFPYSPLWYLITAPFGAVGLDLVIVSNVLNAAIDVSRSILIAYIVLRLFQSQRAALIAAGVYHLFEMPYYLLSWGNWPTQLGLWGGLVLIAVIAATFERPWQRATLIAVTLAAVLSMLTYTVLGIVTFTMVGMLAILEWMHRSRPGKLRGRTLVAGLVLAELVAFVLYHIWYVPTIWADTVPAITKALTAQEREWHGAPRPSFLGALDINWDYSLNHLTWAVIGLLPLGAVLAWFQMKQGRSIIIAWLFTLVFYSVFDWVVAEMIFKHIFFLLPLFAIFIGLVFSALWSRQAWALRIIPIALCLYLASFVAERWWFYIMVKRHY